MAELPFLAARWLAEALDGDLPGEARATCDDCTLCRAPGEPGAPAPGYGFRPGVKCCTYMPALPSFHVGRLLADRSPELELGRARVRAAMKSGAVATPLGLWPSPAMAAVLGGVWQHQRGLPVLACPYLDQEGGGRCSIWREREATCATWFCRHDDGVLGARTWTAVLGLLRHAERAVALHCAIELGLEGELLGELLDGYLEVRDPAERRLHGHVADDGAMDPSLHRRAWGAWAGREEAFYLRAGEVASALAWADVRRLGGVRLDLALRHARAAAARRHPPALPGALVLAEVERAPTGDGEVDLCAAETPLDPVRLPLAAAAALRSFDGRDVAAACRDADVEPELLARLVRHGVLVAPDGRDHPPRDRAPRRLTRGDRLRVFRGYRGAEATSRLALDDSGETALVLQIDNREITLDEPETIAFGAELTRHQNGFAAGDATSWGPGGAAIAWERARELLEELCEEGVLQPAAPPRRTP
jgi:hypothetical protein